MFFILYCHILYFHMIFIYCAFHILCFSYTIPVHILFICFHVLCTFHTMLFMSILLSHSSVMLLISCHIFYTCHFIFGFMSANTLEVDMGNNCMYLKVLSLYETVISICLYPKVSSLYETVTYAMCYLYPKVLSLH